MPLNKLNTIDDLKNFPQEEIKPLQPPICPMEGEFIGYKKCMVAREGEILFVIVTLKIPADALRISPFRVIPIGTYRYIKNEKSRKCRCSHAEVIKIESFDGKKQYQSAISLFASNKSTYKVGEYVYTDEFDDNETKECTHGIHFFMTRKEAENFFMG